MAIAKPAGKAWSVRFERLEGGFALGLLHRRPGGVASPNHVVERVLDAHAPVAPSLEGVLEVDTWARQQASATVAARSGAGG